MGMRYELRATQDNGRVESKLFPTLAQALTEAERYRAHHDTPQVWGVVVRDRLLGTGDLEVANQVVVFELPSRFNILTITDGGSGVLLVTTQLNHGFGFASAGEFVTISGTSVSAYDGNYQVDDVHTLDSFLLDSNAYTVDSTGGTWALT